MRTTSERFSRLVAWRLAESLCSKWRFIANAGAFAMFIWVAISVVLALTSGESDDHMSGVSTMCLAVSTYFSGVVAKMMGVVANARQLQVSNKAVTGASASLTDLCFALALAVVGSMTAPSILSLLGSTEVGIACSVLLGASAVCVLATLPTAYRLSAPNPQV